MKYEYFDLGYISQEMGMNRKAYYYYRKEIAATKYYKAYFNLAVLLFDSKRYSEAEQNFKAVLKQKTHFHKALNNLGIIYTRKRHFTKAVRSLKKAIAIKNLRLYKNNLEIALDKMR